jgi:hypothetical protein
MDALGGQSPVWVFPIRHHSPACAFHLGKALSLRNPDIVLIEGPSDSNALIEHLASPLNKAPFAIYYTYREKKSERKAACYFPLLDFSPELAAIRWAAQSGVPCRFVDMPYALSQASAKRDEGKREAYYGDSALFESRYTALLCEKEGVRGPGELWEKLFETRGLKMGTEEFVSSMLSWCHYARASYTEEMLEEEGTLAREEWMSAEIQKALSEGYSRALLVTGGFHAEALAQNVGKGGGGALKKEKAPPGESSAWLIPYSFSESDQLSGYASGMPYPAFYQKAHEALEKGSQKPYADACLALFAQAGGALRKRKSPVTLSDEAAAFFQSAGLASLRGKAEPGAWEALDSVRSAFVKGPLDAQGQIAVAAAEEAMRGDAVGEIKSGAAAVPLLADFMEKAAAHGIKAKTTAPGEATLNILTSKPHRAASAFLHRLAFLGAGFAEMESGPNYAMRDPSRVREHWRYRFTAAVESAIIEQGYLGGTVREAAASLALKRASDASGAKEYSALAVECAVMSLPEHVGMLLSGMHEAIAEDGSFSSLVGAIQNLAFLGASKPLVGLEGDFAEAPLNTALAKASSLLATLTASGDREDYELAKQARDLCEAAIARGRDRSVFVAGLREALLCKELPPSLEGSACGLLYAMGEEGAPACLQRAESYFYGTGGEMAKSGRFLAGLFLGAQDILFAEGGAFLKGMDHVFMSLSEEEFLSALPDVRLAMSEFAPSQINRAAAAVSGFYGSKPIELEGPAVPDGLFALGRDLDRYAKEALSPWTLKQP